MVIEPSGDFRIAARQIREMFLAFVEAGFTADQALDLCLALLPSSRKDTK